MKLFSLLPLLPLLLCLSAANVIAQRAVLKNPSTGALLEGFATGANTITLSAPGTLHWTSGATLGGSASAFRTAAGLAIGTDVQAYSANLTTYAGIAPSANVQSLLAAADYSAMRTQLGLVIGTNVQAYDAELAAFAALANSAGMLRNNGSGTLSYLGTSAGGNGGDDSGKVLVFGSSGDITGYSSIKVRGASGRFGQLVNNGLLWSDVPGNLTHAIVANEPTGIRDHTLPDVSGTFITTGNLSSITATGTITSGTWNGTDIALAYIAQGGASDGQYLRWNNTGGVWEPGTISSGLTINTTTTSGASAGDILTSDGTNLQKLTPGTGVATWLATPTIANLNSAVSDANLATTGANTLTGTQTINGLIDCSHGLLLGDGSGSGANGPYISLSSGVTWRILRRDGAGGTTIMEWNTNDANVTFPGIIGIGRVYSQRDTYLGRDAAANIEFGLDHSTTPTNQVLKSHDVTTGTGAKLTVAGGKGSAAGGAVALATSATNGSPVEHVTVSAAGLITLGSRGSGLSAVATVVKASHDCASIAAGATETTTATITGAAAGSTFIPSPMIHEGLVISAARTGTDTITITFYNPTAAPIDASAVDVRVTEIAF